MLNAIIKIMLQRPKHSISSFGDFSLPGYIKESTDDGDDGVKPDLFDVSGEADSISLKRKFVRTDGELHNQALPNDEGHPMSDATLPEPTSQPHEQEHSTFPPSLPQAATSPSVVDGPRRKGRIFPSKETTDYLKAWLRHHSNHPYPSEDEKTRLCHATGLSRTQLSGLMVSVSHKKCLLLGTLTNIDLQARRRHRAVMGGEVDLTQDSPDPKRVKMKNDQSGECLCFVMVYIHAEFTFD